MRVDPQHPCSLPFAPGEGRNARDAAHRDGVVTAEHQGKMVQCHDPFDLACDDTRGAGDFAEIAGAFIAHLELFHVFDDHIAVVDHLVAQLPEPPIHPSDPNGRGSHVDPPSTRAEIHRHTQNMDDHFRGAQRTWRRSTRPLASSLIPSRASNCSWISSAPEVARRLMPPLAFTTRCHGTVLLSGKAWRAYPTCRACPASPANDAICP